jgi:Tfp pilus assembly protein PilF
VSEPRRNDPCPCGSGKRYKECHGQLDGRSPGGLDALLSSALAAHQQGRVDEAERGYRDVLTRDPANAVATHYLGLVAWQRGDLRTAEDSMRASVAGGSRVADFHNNLGLLLRDTGRGDEAIAQFDAALAINPGWIDVYSNMALTFEALGRWDDAIDAYRKALARSPVHAIARQNLARSLLTRGDFAEGWREYRWRLLAQGLATQPPAEATLPRDLAGRDLALVSEQGLGDVLFFLRFAPALVQRGARLAFRGDTRLHSILERTGLFALGLAPLETATGDARRLFIGDLPWLLQSADDAFTPPLPLEPEPERVARIEETLAHLPRPRVAITWRGGVLSTGPSRSQLKRAPIDALGRSLAGKRASWISVQRFPEAGEREALERAIGAPVTDMSSANADLEDMLALMSIADAYVGVSNANTHLRAGLGKSLDVLVPNPPEWRWGLRDSSPWFPQARIYRETPQGDWSAALACLEKEFAP